MKQLLLMAICFVIGLMTGLVAKEEVKENETYYGNISDWVQWKNNNEGKPWE